MGEADLRQRLAAILVADVVGYSRLMSADERGTLAALDAAGAVLRTHVEAQRGRVFATGGDSLLAVFETATGAVAAAVATQRSLTDVAADVPEERRLRFRIGIHLGDVFERADGDVYGDGVNIAARLEALAEPGGIVVSDSVRSAVRSAQGMRFEDRGLHAVKNIPEPVHVHAVLPNAPADASVPAASARARAPAPRRALVAGAAGLALVAALGAAAWMAMRKPAVEPAGSATAPAVAPAPPAASAALALPSRPSIAVLPFDNLSRDAEQGYFADGMTEDLITDLSKVAGLFVIARNSTFAYKGKARDVREVAKALGVRYVLEGSVRRSGNDVRVNAQLIDASTGGHVWADRYDGELKGVFALQDKVTRNVVAALAVELTKDDKERVARRGTSNAQAYDVFLKGWQHYLRQTPEDFKLAIERFKEALALDPQYARAHAALAAVHWDAYTRYWGMALGSQGVYEVRSQAESYLAKAMADPTPLAHQVAAAMHLFQQRHKEALAEATRGVAADPNDPDGHLAMANVLSFTGRPREALEFVERAMRANPHYPSHYLYQQGLALFGLDRLGEAATSLERALAANREDHWSQRLLLSTYGLLERRDDAARIAADLKTRERRGRAAAFDPLTIKAVSFWYPFEHTADAARFARGLRAAGVPD